MPQNERRLQRHERPAVLGNKPRSVVSGGASLGKNGGVGKAVCRADEMLTAMQRLRDWSIAVLSFGVEFDPHGIGIEIVEKDLNVKRELPVFLFDGGAAKTQRGPVFCELGLPIPQIGR